jgi:hypothetical protein
MKPQTKMNLISLMKTFLQAVVEEDTKKLEGILKEDIILYSDGGGKVAAAVNPLIGRNIVVKFLTEIAKKNKKINFYFIYPGKSRVSSITLNSRKN